MRKILFFQKKKKTPALLWNKTVYRHDLRYYGGDVDAFLLEFERIENEILFLWNGNQLTWGDYQRSIAEVEEAKQLFVRFAYN